MQVTEEKKTNSETEYLDVIKESFQSQNSIWRELSDQNLLLYCEYLPPAIRIIVMGGGNDVYPIVDIASTLGWDIIVIDGRAKYADRNRFAKACDVILAKPEHVLSHIHADPWTAYLLMTHNYTYDKIMLYDLAQKHMPYIGMLGPKKKLNRMIEEFEIEGRRLEEDQLNNVYSPAGLDIGAGTPEEIALSIISEIKAVMSNKTGKTLSLKNGSKHL
jgi:xanthine/CO dehydrogenase XdhC/CoxF family maturation factor